jgi:hypothetical protein
MYEDISASQNMANLKMHMIKAHVLSTVLHLGVHFRV